MAIDWKTQIPADVKLGDDTHDQAHNGAFAVLREIRDKADDGTFTGPAGPKGEAGPAGEKGPAGPKGADGAPTKAEWDALVARVTALEKTG